MSPDGATFASLIYVAFTKNIPREIEEAARMDGCGMYATFFRVVFPLLMPATRTVIALTIFFSWNDFQGPFIYLNDGKTPTLMLEIYTFKTNIGASAFFSTQWAADLRLMLLGDAADAALLPDHAKIFELRGRGRSGERVTGGDGPNLVIAISNTNISDDIIKNI